MALNQACPLSPPSSCCRLPLPPMASQPSPLSAPSCPLLLVLITLCALALSPVTVPLAGAPSLGHPFPLCHLQGQPCLLLLEAPGLRSLRRERLLQEPRPLLCYCRKSMRTQRELGLRHQKLVEDAQKNHRVAVKFLKASLGRWVLFRTSLPVLAPRDLRVWALQVV